MLTRHFDHWPNRVPKSLAIPETNPYHNLEVSAARYPNKVAIHYYGGEVTYRRLLEEVDALAGFLQQDVGVSSGDRVMLFMQNSPQFIIAYYAIL
ncbi:MAG: AMP-binding protein, partial [Planifilum sp.]